MTDLTRRATAVALLTFSQLAGVWRAAGTADRAAVTEVLPDLARVLTGMVTIDHTAAADATRCGNCDHLASFHAAGGCWLTINHGEPGDNLTCPCPLTTVAGMTAATIDDFNLIALAIHRAICCPTVLDRANQDDEDVAQSVLRALLAAGRLVPVAAPDGS